MRSMSFIPDDFMKNLLMKPQNEFRKIYDESGISRIYDDYVKKMIYVILSATLTTIISASIVHRIIFKLSWALTLGASLSLSLTFSCATGFILMYYPIYRRNQIRSKIEESLVYTLSYMTILSASGMAIENILERVSQIEENSSIRQLTNKFLMDIKLFGYEVSAALEDIARRSASEVLRKVFNSINNNIQTSGDLKNLLTFEVENQLQIKRNGLKRFLSTLTYMGEMYVAMIVIAPILFIIMITILSVLGGSSGNSSIPQLLLIVFFGIPILSTGLIIVLDTTLGGDY